MRERPSKSGWRCLWRNLVFGESGIEILEYLLMMSVLVILLFGLVYFLIMRPDLVDKALLIAVFSAIVGGIAWSGKQAISSFHRRAQLLILETLSDGKPHRRDEISVMLERQWLAFRLMPLHLDALADLIPAGRIVLDNGAYVVETDTSKAKGSRP